MVTPEVSLPARMCFLLRCESCLLQVHHAGKLGIRGRRRDRVTGIKKGQNERVRMRLCFPSLTCKLLFWAPCLLATDVSDNVILVLYRSYCTVITAIKRLSVRGDGIPYPPSSATHSCHTDKCSKRGGGIFQERVDMSSAAFRKFDGVSG